MTSSAETRTIERLPTVKLLATLSKQLPRHAGSAEPDQKPYTRVRELYRSLPPAAEDETAIAIVIGNRNYTTLPASETSRNDADAIYAVLTEHLGYLQDNVILLRDAKRADFDRVFGTASEPGGELAGLVRAHPGARVLLYYSGLGATDAAQTETYLLPVDAERYREERSGYSLASLYAALNRTDRGQVGARAARGGVRPRSRRLCAPAERSRDDEERLARWAARRPDRARGVRPRNNQPSSM